jgi:hypothetical protein
MSRTKPLPVHERPVFPVTNDELMPGRIAGASSRGELALAPFAIGKMKGCSWTRRDQ